MARRGLPAAVGSPGEPEDAHHRCRAREGARGRMTRGRRITALFRPYRRPLFAVLALIVVSAGVSMVSPFLLRAVLDEALPERDTKLLAWLVGGMIAVSVFTGVLGVGQTYLSNVV